MDQDLWVEKEKKREEAILVNSEPLGVAAIWDGKLNSLPLSLCPIIPRVSASIRFKCTNIFGFSRLLWVAAFFGKWHAAHNNGIYGQLSLRTKWLGMTTGREREQADATFYGAEIFLSLHSGAL